jgi:hypothetical protein
MTKAQTHTEVCLAELSAAQTQMQMQMEWTELTKVVPMLLVSGERQATRLRGSREET